MRTKLRFLTLSFCAMALLAPFMGQAHDTPVTNKVAKKSEGINPMESGNIARGKPTMASHEEPGHPSSHALDDDSSTYWAGSPHGQWWQVDLEGFYQVHTIEVYTYSDGTRYYQYAIESSHDGVTWSPLVDHTDNTTPATTAGDIFSVDRKARFLRVNMNYNSANVGVHIREFKALGDFLYPTTENIALHKPTTASGDEPGHPSSHAVDGDDSLNSWWGANPYTQWWQVDLQGTYAVDVLNVVNYYDGERYYQYHIDASIDGVNWTRIVDRDYHSNGLATRNGDTFPVNGINARYLRVSMTYNSANVGVHLVEFRAFGNLIAPSPNHVNIALNKPTAASSEESGRPSSDAVDGDDSRNSWWGANPYAQWWQVDLEGVYQLNTLNVVNYYDGERYYDYTIEASFDGSNWESIVSRNSNHPATRAGDNFLLLGVTARYLRVNMNFNSANVGVHIVEFRAYGDLVPPPSTNENIALNKPTMASGNEPGHPSSHAVDGDDSRNSWWGANPYAQWWQVDLEGLYLLNRLNVVNYYDGTRHYQYNIVSSIDGINWSPLVDFNDNTEPATKEGDEFNVHREARFLRVNVTFNSANVGVHLVEFRAFGTKIKTYVPDDNFERRLVQFGYDNVLDDYVATSIVENIETLQISESGIESLKGIEDFKALKFLHCSENGISYLDLSNNKNLVGLHVHTNRLAFLNLSENTLLETIDFRYNPLTNLDLSKNIHLKYIEGDSESLRTLDIKNGNNQNIESVQLTGAYQLNCVQVDDVDFARNNENWHIEDSSWYSVDCATPPPGYTYIPDDAFEQSLIGLGHDDIPDNFVRTENIETIEFLTLSWVSDLTGIQDFKALRKLTMGSSPLAGADFSGNPELESLTLNTYVSDNGSSLEAINIINNPKLQELSFDFAGTRLPNLSRNKELLHLYIDVYYLGEFDISHNTKLRSLNITGTLERLDVSKNLLLESLTLNSYLLSELDLSNNGKLQSLRIYNGKIFPDLSFNKELTSLNFDLLRVENPIVVDLSHNSKLKEVIGRIRRAVDSLEPFNINLNNQHNSILESLSLTGDFLCVKVDDIETAMNNPSWHIPHNSSFSDTGNCTFRYTRIPDYNFEKALIDLGHDELPTDGWVKTANIETIKELSINGNYSVSDITGIEDFTTIEDLFVYDNYMTSVDLSQNMGLKNVYLANNKLNSLVLGELPNLMALVAWENKLESLDVSGCPNLTLLQVELNQLYSLDVSYNGKLEELRFKKNNIKSIDTSQNFELQYLSVDGNLLTTLDVSSNSNLNWLHARNNPELISINSKNGNNTSMKTYILNCPKLTCVEVDDVTIPVNNDNWVTDFDPALYSTNCYSGTTAAKTPTSIISMSPNPAFDFTQVNSTGAVTEFEKVEIFDLTGKKIKTLENTPVGRPLYVGDLTKGIYIVKTVANGKIQTKRLVVQ